MSFVSLTSFARLDIARGLVQYSIIVFSKFQRVFWEFGGAKVKVIMAITVQRLPFFVFGIVGIF